MPETDFSCRGTVAGEYYADVGTSCQVFHVCTALSEGLAQRFSFLCPNGNLTLRYISLKPPHLVISSAPGTMFHQQLKICHWWFYVDCESSEQFYNLDPDISRTDSELTIENFGRADRGGNNFPDDQSLREGLRYGDNLADLDYRPRARRGRPQSYGDQRPRGYNRRYSRGNTRYSRRPPIAPVSRRRIGSRATIIRDNGANRQRRLQRRRTLKAIPSSSFRKEQSRKRIARQVETARKKTNDLKKDQDKKERNFEEEIKTLREEILVALSFL